MTTTLVVMGVSGVGKTTVARELVRSTGWEFAEGDDLHPQANRDKMAAGQPLDDDDRWPWLHRVADWIGEREQAGRSAVITCSALKRRYRDLLRDGHPSVRFVHLDGDHEMLRRRLEARKGHYMPAALLDSQIAALEPLGADEPGFRVAADGDTAEVVRRALEELSEQAD